MPFFSLIKKYSRKGEVFTDYITLDNYAFEEYTVNKSRFIGYACPVLSSEEAVEFIASIRQKHSDATHNVYAYAVRSPEYSRYSDDGEPQGTAGMPVLDVIKKSGLTDCCIVVTRYFGGILLGTGGLVRAYSHSAKLAVEKAGIVKMSMCSQMVCICDYSFYPKLSALIPDCHGVIENTVFGENVSIAFRIPEYEEPSFAEKLTQLSFGKLKAEKTGSKFDKI